MTEVPIEDEVADTPEDDLATRLRDLEREFRDARQVADDRVLRAELKVEAMRMGMIDLDGLTFLNTDALHIHDNGEISGVAKAMDQLKKDKPWLFLPPSSSSIAKVPPARPVRQKLATEMTDAEYKAAREAIIRRTLI